MKGLIVLFLVACTIVVGAQNEIQYLGECPPEQEGDWSIEMLLRHEDCNKFYKCTFGVPIEYKCYGNLYFNLETWECDWPENVDCDDRNIPEEDISSTLGPITVPTTTTTEPTTTSTTTTTTPEPTTTSTTTTSTTTPAPTTTTTTTTTTPAPTTTSTTTTTTPAPTTTSTTTTTTPAPTTTSTTTTTTPEPTTTTTTTTTPAPTTTTQAAETTPEFQENGCPVDPHIHWLLPHESDCNLFYYCVWGQKVLRSCVPVLHFNPILQVCDWPSDAGCTVSANKQYDFMQNLKNLFRRN